MFEALEEVILNIAVFLHSSDSDENAFGKGVQTCARQQGTICGKRVQSIGQNKHCMYSETYFFAIMGTKGKEEAKQRKCSNRIIDYNRWEGQCKEQTAKRYIKKIITSK